MHNDGRSRLYHRAREGTHRRIVCRLCDRGSRPAVAARSCRRDHTRAWPPRDRRLPSGRTTHREHVPLELARDRRRQRTRARPEDLCIGNARRRRRRCQWPYRSHAALHPPVLARSPRRRTGGDAHAAGRLHESIGDCMTAPARRTLAGERHAPVAPRLGFLGTGWIGRHRLRAIAASGIGTVVGVSDVSADAAREASEGLTPGPRVARALAELLDLGLDGVVIATPSALHAEQAIASLERGVAVFCQKPLARTAAETRRVVDAARAADRLLAVDLSYRFTDAMQQIRSLVRSGALGSVYATDLVFHN